MAVSASFRELNGTSDSLAAHATHASGAACGVHISQQAEDEGEAVAFQRPVAQKNNRRIAVGSSPVVTAHRWQQPGLQVQVVPHM